MIGLRPYQITVLLAISILLYILLHLAWEYGSPPGAKVPIETDPGQPLEIPKISSSSSLESTAPDDGGLNGNAISNKPAQDNIPTAVSNQVSLLSAQTDETQLAQTPISQVLVVARLQDQNVDWIDDELTGMPTAVYVADDETALFHAPMKKGHEAMIYLTYIIDNYHSLSDVTIFVHNHKQAWHNNDLLSSQMSVQLKQLQLDHVIHQGYFNLRCHLEPGCPSWIKLDNTNQDISKAEETIFAKIWTELFPDIEMPLELSQPCCSQFAVSRDKILTVPLDRWNRYRNWLIYTDLDDVLSGRIFEYTWQLIFNHDPTYCPSMRSCYCKGYSVCFEKDGQLQDWLDVRNERWRMEQELNDDPNVRLRDGEIREEIDYLQNLLSTRLEQAVQRGGELRQMAKEEGSHLYPDRSLH
jgi:hypothetical protein